MESFCQDMVAACNAVQPTQAWTWIYPPITPVGEVDTFVLHLISEKYCSTMSLRLCLDPASWRRPTMSQLIDWTQQRTCVSRLQLTAFLKNASSTSYPLHLQVSQPRESRSRRRRYCLVDVTLLHALSTASTCQLVWSPCFAFLILAETLG